MGKNETKILVEKEKTKRFVITERIIKHLLIGSGVILFIILLISSLYISDWR